MTLNLNDPVTLKVPISEGTVTGIHSDGTVNVTFSAEGGAAIELMLTKKDQENLLETEAPTNNFDDVARAFRLDN